VEELIERLLGGLGRLGAAEEPVGGLALLALGDVLALLLARGATPFKGITAGGLAALLGLGRRAGGEIEGRGLMLEPAVHLVQGGLGGVGSGG